MYNILLYHDKIIIVQTFFQFLKFTDEIRLVSDIYVCYIDTIQFFSIKMIYNVHDFKYTIDQF